MVIPARNEEANIERVVRSVAAQEPVREIIVVDDGSEDATPRILERLKTEIPLLRVIRNDGLPEGWVGKNYALATGARLAKGEWLLFTDADTYHKPGSLMELLERAECTGAALLSVSPGQLTPTWWEKAVIPFVYWRLSRLYPFEEISNPASPRAAANGQFLLIRRDVFERVGGFDAIRGEILEDVALARRVKQSGGRLIFVPGSQWIETRMYSRLSDMWDGWTKNLYQLYDKDLSRLFRDLAEVSLLDLFPWLALLSLAGMVAIGVADSWGKFAMLGLIQMAGIRVRTYQRQLGRIGFRASLSSLEPIGGALFILLLLNSMRAYRWGGHVSWKGRSYPVQGARSVAR